MKKFKYLVSNDGLYINTGGDYYLTRYIYNSKELLPTFNSKWGFLEGETKIVSVEERVSDRHINRRWVIKDEVMFPNMEKSFPYEDLSEDGDGDWYGKMAEFHALYKLEYDLEPQPNKPVEYEAICIGTVDKIEGPIPFSYSVQRTQYSHEGKSTITPINVSYDEFTSAVVPGLLLHNTRCSLDSKTTYRIIREHIKDNIDGRQARVTSDYDFCFTVKKKYKLPSTKVTTTEIKKSNGKSYMKPQFKTTIVEYKEEEIFEMTSSVDKYKNYTIINGFTGENLEDLKENIDLYLKELMLKINEPVKYCPDCNGTGIIHI